MGAMRENRETITARAESPNGKTGKILRAAAFCLALACSIAAAAGNAGAAGTSVNARERLAVVRSGTLASMPRSDAGIIVKKASEVLSRKGISASDYELKVISGTNAYVARSKDGKTDSEVAEAIESVERNYYSVTRSEVIYLQYANAGQVAAILNNIYSPRIYARPPAPPKEPAAAGKNAGGEPGPPEQKVKTIKKKNDEIDISHDLRTNSIVVTAPQNVIDLVKDTIQKIDRRTSLVHIKVLIAEVTLDDLTQFGLEWKYAAQNLVGGNSMRQDAATDFGNFDLKNRAKLSGLKYSVIEGKQFDSFLQALNGRSHIKVLSSPQLLTTNNSSAYFEETIKVPTLQTTSTSNGVISSSIEYQEIGIKLGVTPQVNHDGYISMAVNQTIQNLMGTNNDLNAPTFSHRLINTSVISKSGSTVVISGFIKNNLKKSVFKVPFFERIPIVGELMSRATSMSEKTELMVFLTPVIVGGESQDKKAGDDVPKGSELGGRYGKAINEMTAAREADTAEARFYPVVDARDGMVILGAGKKDGIKPGDILLAFSAAEKARPSDRRKRPATIVVDVVRDKTVIARVTSNPDGITPQSGDSARWPSGDSEYFEDLRQTEYVSEEYIGLHERRYVRTVKVKNVTSTPISKADASYRKMSPRLRYFIKKGRDFMPLKMVVKSVKDDWSYITVYFNREIAPNEEFTLRTEDTLPDNLVEAIRLQASDAGFYNGMGREVRRNSKVEMSLIIHHPYRLETRDFDVEPVVMDNRYGGHTLVWTHSGRSFDANGKWRYAEPAAILADIAAKGLDKGAKGAFRDSKK